MSDDILDRLRERSDRCAAGGLDATMVAAIVLVDAIAEIERLRETILAIVDTEQPDADPPKPERWEVIGVLVKPGGEHNAGISEDFEPFAATDRQVWFRRRVAA